jgi:hypothetical protein
MKLDDIRKLDKDEILELLGLQRRPSSGTRVAETLGTLGIGLLLGAGITLLLAPRSGRELRGQIRERLQCKSSDGEGATA